MPVYSETTNTSQSKIPFKEKSLKIYLVDWEDENDSENPRNWCKAKKWRATVIMSLYTFLTSSVSTICAPALPFMSASFGNENSSVQELYSSIYLLAWAIGPLLVAPLSELWGRKKVLDGSMALLSVFNLACALSKTSTQMCIFRFLAGLAGSSPICIGSGVLGDIFSDRDRNIAVSLYALGPTVGPTLTPIISSYIVENTSWRWCFWLMVILSGVITVGGLWGFPETYPPVILERKKRRMQILGDYGEAENLRTIYQDESSPSIKRRIKISMQRPLKLLVMHPMVFGLGMFMAITFGCFYVLMNAFPEAWTTVYGFSLGTSGLMFIAIMVGYVVGIVFFGICSEVCYLKLVKRNNNVPEPEFRLPCLIFSGVFIPISLFWFGWSVEKKVCWISGCLASALFSFSLMAVFQTILTYLIEMDPLFAASSVAAVATFRCLFGFAFPLFAPQMFKAVGYGWGCSIWGFISLAAGIPFPMFVLWKGKAMRLWANKRFAVAEKEYQPHRIYEKTSM